MIPWNSLAADLKQLSTSQINLQSFKDNCNQLQQEEIFIFAVHSKKSHGNTQPPMVLIENAEGMFALSYRPGINLPRSNFCLRRTSENPYNSIVLSINGFEFEMKDLFKIDDLVGHQQLFSKFENDCIAGAVYQAGVLTNQDITRIVSETEIQTYFEVWRRVLGLHDANQTRQWFSEQGISLVRVRDYLVQKIFMAKMGCFWPQVSEFFIQAKNSWNQQGMKELPIENKDLEQSPLVSTLKKLLEDNISQFTNDFVAEYFDNHRSEFDEIQLATFSEVVDEDQALPLGKKNGLHDKTPFSDLIAEFPQVSEMEVTTTLRQDLPFHFSEVQNPIPATIRYTIGQKAKIGLVLGVHPATLNAKTRWKILDILYWRSLNVLKSEIKAEIRLSAQRLFDQAGYISF